MQIVLVGVDHGSAPIVVRERLVYSPQQIPQVLNKLRSVAQECVLVSTCNRTEAYAVFSEIEEGHKYLLRILSDISGISLSELEFHGYHLFDEQAVLHLYGVACGIFSLVLGESQIQGQVVEALEIAQSSGFAGPITSGLFRGAIGAGKRARSETGISRNAASVSFVAVQLAKKLIPTLDNTSILLVGSGKMSELTAHHLCENGANQLIIINRTPLHAYDLAKRFGVKYRSFKELTLSLVEADVVISSTTAPVALITHQMMQEVMALRAERPLLLIDLSLPRDVDPEVADMPNVHLYNLDDLKVGVNEGIQLRNQEVEQVQEIIEQEAEVFKRWLSSLSVADTISELRQYADLIRTQELTRTLHRLPNLTQSETAIIQDMTTRIVNKLLHIPMLRLKEAAVEGQEHMYSEAIRYLFDLKE